VANLRERQQKRKKKKRKKKGKPPHPQLKPNNYKPKNEAGEKLFPVPASKVEVLKP